MFNIGGWATAQFADDRKPFTREELDAIAPDNPVALQESYYQVFLNSRALKEFGIEAGKPDPPDFVSGSIMRDAAGKPTGIIRGDIAATRPVAARLPKLAPERLEASTQALVQDMNRAASPRSASPAAMPTCWRSCSDGRRRTAFPSACSASAARPPARRSRSNGRFQQIARMKLFQGDNYIDDVVFGESVYTPLHDRMFAIESDPQPDQLAQWRRMAMEIAKARLPLHVHAELRDTIDAFLDQIEAVNKEYPIRNLRWALAHVNQINASQLERMKKLGMYAAVHPWAVINGAIMHEGFGDGADDMPPLATIQKSGITWGLGSDGTAANQYLPMTALYFAVTGKMAGGLKVIRQTIGREDALIAYTRKNAYFVFQENNLGSIQAGQAGRSGRARSRLPHRSCGPDQGHQAGDDGRRREDRVRRRG